MPQDWTVATIDEQAARSLARALDLNPITTRILINRGIDSPEAARRYLSPGLSDIPDPFLLPDMEAAVDRILAAMKSGEKIAIFGDYDVDGIAGTALLALFLKELGQDPITMLPNRAGEGYGLSRGAVEMLHEMGAGLIITVDNGTRAVAEIAYARKKGIDVIVTDHHALDGPKPNASALVNPHFLDQNSPCRQLAGCGVAFMLTLALRRRIREQGNLPDPEPNLRQHLDLVALGTVADIVSLTGTNRTLVRHGLVEIGRSAKPGIRRLLEVSGTSTQDIGPGAVAFRLAPRINAAGRIGDAHAALNLLTCSDTELALQIAQQLDRSNRQRQRQEERILIDVDSQLQKDQALATRAGIVMYAKNWHVGVLGIVASKITERLGRPAVVISLDTTPARGSARSAGGIDLLKALSQCQELLVRYGGHDMAAGLSIDAHHIETFAGRFDQACSRLTPTRKPRGLAIDAMVDPADITDRLAQEISCCQPFGIGNPEPILAMADMNIYDRRIVGQNHLKLKVGNQGQVFDAIGFGFGDKLSPDATRISLAFVPQLKSWRGVTSIQLKIRDLKSASD
jgi:single-stranded-DNA-specific exonuclease